MSIAIKNGKTFRESAARFRFLPLTPESQALYKKNIFFVFRTNS